MDHHSARAWKLLSESVGTYSGRGINHEGEEYVSRLQLKLELPEKLISLQSQARGGDDRLFHGEVSWIGRDLDGELTLYVDSTNHPGVTPHAFEKLEESVNEKKIQFGFGEPTDKKSFREKITLSIFSDGSIEHAYAWAMPGEDIQPRSASRMQPEVFPTVADIQLP